MVWIEGKSVGSKAPAFAPFGFEPDVSESEGDVYRVRHLITKLVRETVRDFHHREKFDAFRAVTPDEISKGLEIGKFGRSRSESQHVDLETAIGRALQAFEDGLFLLFVDSEEKKSLDDVVSLLPETKVTIIRLTSLAGA